MAELTRQDKKVLKKAIMREALKFEAIWKSNVPVYRGRYKNSIVTNFDDQSFTATVSTNVNYAKELEYGLRPDTWPEQSQIRKWVERKLGVQDEEEIRQAAYLISRKIFKEGVDENASMRRSIKEYNNQ